jgi:hypothetical protein
MTFTAYPNGVSSFGIPMLGGGPQLSIPSLPEQVLFVDQSGQFTSVGESVPTIQGALNRVRNAAGATIFVFPGTYAENLVVEDDMDYLSIVGAQLAGYARPDIIPASGTALEVLAQGFNCRSVRFAGSDSDTVIQRGNGFAYNDVVFDGDAGMAATEAALRLVGSTTDDSYSASEGIIAGSLFRGTTSGAGIIVQHSVAAGGGIGSSDVEVRGNRFYGNGADILSAVNTSGGGAGIMLNWLIAQNYFMTVGAAYVYGNLAAGAAGDLAANTCLAAGNWFADDAFVAAQWSIAGQPGQMFSGNYDAAGLINGSTFNN